MHLNLSKLSNHGGRNLDCQRGVGVAYTRSISRYKPVLLFIKLGQLKLTALERLPTVNL
jgi:hypothetical protein